MGGTSPVWLFCNYVCEYSLTDEEYDVNLSLPADADGFDIC